MRSENWDEGELLREQQLNGTLVKRPSRKNG